MYVNIYAALALAQYGYAIQKQTKTKLQCSSCGTLKRHNSVLKGPIAANLTKQGYNFNIEHTILDDDDKKAGDAYVSNPYVDEPKTILDVTISCPTSPTYICNAAAASNDHCTKLAEKNKHTKYDDRPRLQA